jgi:hypothetical protein
MLERRDDSETTHPHPTKPPPPPPQPNYLRREPLLVGWEQGTTIKRREDGNNTSTPQRHPQTRRADEEVDGDGDQDAGVENDWRNNNEGWATTGRQEQQNGDDRGERKDANKTRTTTTGRSRGGE